ncbi:ubiquinol-cytochrome-c reductase complex assembly factor 1 isoform X1 [Neodiprion virginianus]|uniref:ubiquinol-cytochrome-c reductase complex assembly factor 1 isoform X1 n=1 Tax=Neodiprion fabricii TaxID=2872261 RepID=UPI001ED8DF7F|nr:ubiquinol-cytochrome-c reductase complex assembly factor 1 isoform X1 [Neodiprion fabricii]XP_046420950.1 ubiquinol-cytochrome-c reductase complex assembly factor 1 isoform X1 [Neodiprion fabricii]XP_046420951.1 ubiquinol-cytochrome-c reductase complex assembly factor 1 isoform X1 [Neodiprion fabricii]XP_046614839.1 ubiquinol-cytochrome-c reductase complex assembly factor 1 isoform X1 [Neodiprion virginianus]XP_046614840.1 ubiquinol-cytochrome-c reductase complex assembly factor 1 isoform X1
MNTLSRGTLLTRVTSSLLAPRSNLRQITPTVCLLEFDHRTASISTANKQSQSVSQASDIQSVDAKDGFVKRIFKKYNLFNLAESKVKYCSYLLYESIADNINYAQFFKEFNMKDTYYSWFLITELHVWMLMTRAMAENEHGRIARNSVVEAMWGDANCRAKELWSENPSGVRMHLHELSEQFNCAIIGYDEGVNGDDKVLAGAIWRRIFQLECNDPVLLEKLLVYIRKQMTHLDNTPRKDLFDKPKLKWLPLVDP